MDKIEIISVQDPYTEEITEHIIIDRGNGEFSSMPKEYYDEQQAAMPKQEWVEPQLTK